MRFTHAFDRLLQLLPAVLVTISSIAYADAIAFAQVGFTDEQFEQWVFQQYGNAATARTKLKESVELYIEDIHQACTLTDAQSHKLRLASQGDIERFFRKFEDVKKKFQAVRNDQQKVNQIFQDISPLQAQMNSGLFGRDSLLQKCLVNTLNRPQFLKFAIVDKERRRFAHESKIGLAILMLDQAAPLTADQRRKLTELLRNETKPLRSAGRYDYYAMMYQISMISADKLKPLLDDIQWQVFNQQLAQMRGMEQWLKQNGVLSDADDGDVLLPDEQVAAE